MHDLVGLYVIMRDESLHFAFGADLIKTIKSENTEAWTAEFQREITGLIERSVELEKIYARDACPEGIVGISCEQLVNYVEHIADRRLERIDLPKRYHTPNPIPPMSQATDPTKEKNFFETRVTKDQTGSLVWD